MKNKFIYVLATIAVLLLSGCTFTKEKTTSPADFKISGNIWKSEDGGKTWQVKNKAAQQLSVADFDVVNMVINPNDSKDIWVGYKKGGIIRSRNGGELWQATNFISERAYGIEIDPVDSRIIYASGIWQGRGKFWKSENSGETWKEIYTAPANGPFISAALLDKFNRDILLVATSDNQIIKTADSGDTWKNVFQTDSPVIRMRNDCSNSKVVYMLSLNSRLYRSMDSGESWEDITSKINVGGGFTTIEIDPSLSGWLYVTGKNGISRTKDYGETFGKIEVLYNPQSFPVTAIAINPQNSKEVIYTAAQTAYKSDDSGDHWTTFQFNTNKIVNIIKYDPLNPNNIFLAFKSQ